MTLSQAADRLHVDAHTVRRWVRVGVRGQRLIAVTGPDGITTVTGPELERFLRAIGRSPAPVSESPASKRKRSKAADKELAELGV